MSRRIYPLRCPLKAVREKGQNTPVFTLHRRMVHPSLGAPFSRILPQKVDLRPKMPPVYDQGDLGSCTANAICGVVQYENHALQGSRLFLYYNERIVEGDVKEDNGAFLSDGIASLATYGLCPEGDWPYDITKFNIQPPNPCYEMAKRHMTHSVYSLPQSILEMKRALAAGFPFVVGIAVYESFESHAVSRSGVVPMPGPSEECLGGHAVVCVGYNEATNRWIMRNSWGTRWGDAGYFHLPYRYLLDPNLSSDLWVITAIQ